MKRLKHITINFLGKFLITIKIELLPVLRYFIEFEDTLKYLLEEHVRYLHESMDILAYSPHPSPGVQFDPLKYCIPVKYYV